jgi:hypothetical protein
MSAAVPRPIVKKARSRDAGVVMNTSLPLRLSPVDKLDLLRYLDEFRFWHSLDDQRRCARCHQTITGRQVLVYECVGTRGKMRLQCPTAGCMGAASEWVYANPVLAASFKSPTSARKFEALSGNGRMTREPRRRANRPGKLRVAAGAVSNDGRHTAKRKSPGSLRTFLARLPILRPVAMGLHTIHPV